jgi:hypothetical protein
MNKTIVLCYGKTPYTPGRYLEDAFRKLNIPVTVVTDHLDGKQLDPDKVLGVLFIESPNQPTAQNMENTPIPRLYFIHHGRHRLEQNLERIKQYHPHRILMAHSLHLAKHFPVPVEFFPFAVAEDIFNSEKPISNRKYDVAFVGSRSSAFYKNRNKNLKLLKRFLKKTNSSYLFKENVHLKDMANIYSQAKIVFNQSSERVPETMNMRIFEAMGCGALVMTNQVPLQDELFKNRVHLVTYKNSKDLIRKVRYFLKHPSLTQAIAKNGYVKAMQQHTYTHRAKKVIQLLQDLRDKSFNKP